MKHVVVVGGGLAGHAAALRALELGQQVTLLEQGRDPLYPCNSRITGGVMHVAYQDVTLDPAVLFEALAQGTFGQAIPELGRMLSQGALRAVDWLEANGAVFAQIELTPGVYNTHALSPPGAQTTHAQSGQGPDLLLQAMDARIVALGGEIRLGCRVVDLVREGEVVRGVRVALAENDHEQQIDADAVVLADGGFQGNRELVRRHIAPKPEGVVQRGAGTGSGITLQVCEAAGAELIHLDSFYGHLLSADALHNDDLWPYPLLDLLANTGILVDRHGRRFCDEGLGGVDSANKLARRDDPYAVIICDAAVWEQGSSSRMPPPPNPHLETQGGAVFRADTIEALAVAAGLPPAALMETVAAFNQASAQGGLENLPVRRSPPRKTIYAGDNAPAGLVKAPFMAIPTVPGITFTMGGPRIDAHARVLHRAGRPIPGLYAVGSASAGFDGGEDVGYAGGLVKATVTGLAAAEHIAGGGPN